MPPPTTSTATPSSEDDDVDAELRGMEEHPSTTLTTPKPQRPSSARERAAQAADAARPVAAQVHATTAGAHARTTYAPAVGVTRPVAALGAAPRKAAHTPARPATAPASYRPSKAAAGTSAPPTTPALARTTPAQAATKKKTPTTTHPPATPSTAAQAHHQNVEEKSQTKRVEGEQILASHDDLAVSTETMRVDPGKDSASHGEPASYTDMTPKIPATYADKFRRISTHQLAAKIETKDPRLIKQKSLEQIYRRKPMNTGSTEMLQLISFDRSSRTVSPSNLKPISPTPFPSKHRQEDKEAEHQQRESRKRQLEADDTTATQPRPKMQLPAIYTTPPSPTGIEMQQAQGPPDDGAAAVRGAANSNIAPTETKDESSVGKESDEEDNEGARQRREQLTALKEAAYDLLGKAWPQDPHTQEKYQGVFFEHCATCYAGSSRAAQLAVLAALRAVLPALACLGAARAPIRPRDTRDAPADAVAAIVGHVTAIVEYTLKNNNQVRHRRDALTLMEILVTKLKEINKTEELTKLKTIYQTYAQDLSKESSHEIRTKVDNIKVLFK
ncbi:hypothetical protein ACJJTC_012377 [Scirpophaga incertulas]